MPAPDYYLHKFEHLLAWVQAHHGHLLDASLQSFLNRYRRLPSTARRLHVRLLLRRGPLFRIDRLAYPESGDSWQAVLALCLAGVARLAGPSASLQRLELLRVEELRSLLPGVRRTATRFQLLAACTELGAALSKRLPEAVILTEREVIERLKLLYFGNLRQDLREFILSDLGVLRFEAVALQPKLPWRSAAELERDHACHRLGDRLSALLQAGGDEVASAELMSMQAQLAAPARDPFIERRRNRSLWRLARLWQQRDDDAQAVATLALGSGPPAREAHVRLLARRGDFTTSRSALLALRRVSEDPAECHFARHFDPGRGRCRPRPQRAGLRASRLHLPRSLTATRIEMVVAAALSAGGAQVLHLENALVGLLVGLAFWDIVFVPLPGAFVQPFQHGPLDLFEPDFRRRRADLIEARLAALASGSWPQQSLLACWQEKWGVANMLVSWTRFDTATVRRLLATIPAAAQAAICRIALDDPVLLRRGFPDLLLLGDAPGCYDFIEVKGPGDQLRPEQRRWLGELQAAELPGRVLAVQWA